MTSTVRNNRRTEQNDGRKKRLKLLLCSGIGLILFTLLLFLAAVICLYTDASGWSYMPAAYLCCAVSAFFTGFSASKLIGKSGLLCGLLSCLPLCVLLVILCLALYGTVGAGCLIGTALDLLFGALGGVTALNIRHKRRYR